MNTRKFLLTAQDIDQMAGDRKVHFLNPNAVRLNKSLGDAVGLQHMGVHIIHVESGKESTEYHKHHYEEEGIFVLSGSGTVVIEGDQYPIAKGDFLGFPRRTAAHSIVNDGSGTLICLVMGQRLDQDVTDYPKQGKRLYCNSGEWNLVDLKDVRKLRK